jgi:hypothetical protein
VDAVPAEPAAAAAQPPLQLKAVVVDTDHVDADAVRGDYYNHYNTRGLVIGGGVEHMLGDRFYVKAEGRYANYRTNSSRLTGLIGVGVLFGQSKPPVR